MTEDKSKDDTRELTRRETAVRAGAMVASAVAITPTVTAQDGNESDHNQTEENPDEAQGLSLLWDNFLVFVTVMIITFGGIALTSKSMAVASFAAFLVFVHFAVEVGHPLLENILVVALVTVFVGMAFKLWRLEGSGDA